MRLLQANHIDTLYSQFAIDGLGLLTMDFGMFDISASLSNGRSSPSEYKRGLRITGTRSLGKSAKYKIEYVNYCVNFNIY